MSEFKKRRRRHRDRLPTTERKITLAEKAALLILIVVIAVFAFKAVVKERPHGVETVSPGDSTFTPPR